MNDEMVSISITQPELAQIEEALRLVQCVPTSGDPLCQRFSQLADELASRWVAAACAPAAANAFTKGLGANEALFGGNVYADGDIDPARSSVDAYYADRRAVERDKAQDAIMPELRRQFGERADAYFARQQRERQRQADEQSDERRDIKSPRAIDMTGRHG